MTTSPAPEPGGAHTLLTIAADALARGSDVDATMGAILAGASRPYLPATPWNKCTRRTWRGSHVMFHFAAVLITEQASMLRIVGFSFHPNVLST